METSLLFYSFCIISLINVGNVSYAKDVWYIFPSWKSHCKRGEFDTLFVSAGFGILRRGGVFLQSIFSSTEPKYLDFVIEFSHL